MDSVSVIIPCYNAERFLNRTLTSLMDIEEIDEILCIDDGSSDRTKEIVQHFISENKKNKSIKLLSHDGNANKGAAATRNLGIKSAKNKFISFLDADDFYLPDRFKTTMQVFKKHPDADGVYEAVGTFADDEEGKRLHFERMKSLKIEGLNLELTSLTKEIPPKELFKTLVYGKHGWWHFNGLTLKKSAIQKAGLLREELTRFGEDGEFFMRLALLTNLYPGELFAPVAKRVVYEENVTLNLRNPEILRRTLKANVAKTNFLLNVMLRGNFDKPFNRFILNRYLDSRDKVQEEKNLFMRKVLKLYHAFFLVLKKPLILTKII